MLSFQSGGHSAAAGHGNFYRESYTAVLHRTAQPLFHALGLHWETRNYAMGGTASGPEIASCVDAVFGKDIHVLSWDFGMLDGRDASGMGLYFSRAMRLPSRPIGVGIHMSGKWPLGDLEDRGATVFNMEDEKVIFPLIPDTFGKTSAEIEAMPPMVQSLRCDNFVEKGDPTCGDAKWNLTLCPERKFMTSWHPGYKMHALDGNLMALFLMESLEDAIRTLPNVTQSLDELIALDQADQEAFLQADVPSWASAPLPEGIDADVIFHAHNLCHTGRLPAEIRHLGLLTESDQKGFDSYDEGVWFHEALNEEFIRNHPTELMRLVKDDGTRQKCSEVVQMDYKDYLFVSWRDGEKKLVLPNDSEEAYYGAITRPESYIAICLVVCDWGKCPEGNLLEPDILEGQAEILVNDRLVTNLQPWHQCSFLQHADGYLFPKDGKGRFTIKVRNLAERTYIRFSSIVIW